MLERLLRQLAMFVILILLVHFGLSMVGQIVRPLLEDVTRGIERAANVLTRSVFWTVVVGLIGVGGLVRVVRWLRCHDARANRARVTDYRRLRAAERRPAEGVPVHRIAAAPAVDPDPVLDVGEKG